MRPRHLILMALASVVAGCDRLDPPATIAPPGLPVAWRSMPPGSVSPGSPDASASAVRPERWWDGFDEPILSELVADALAANPGVASAVARLEAARALMRPAEAAARPRIDATARLQGERRLAGRDGAAALESRSALPTALGSTGGATGADRATIVRQAGFDASWEIDLFGRVAAGRTAAEADADVASADLAAARATLAADVVRAFVDLRAARTQERLLAEQVGLHGRSAVLASRRRDAGLATDAEVERAEDRLGAAVTRQSAQQEAAETASIRLAVLTGRTSPEASWSQPVGPLRPPRTASASLPADLLRDRPDVRRAEARVLAAAAQVGIAQADLLPRLSLTGSLTAGANVVGNLLSGPVTVLTGGPALTIPLFDRNDRRALRDARMAGWRAAIEDHRLTILDGYADAEAAIARLGTARLGTDTADQTLQRSTRAEERATRQRAAGLSPEDEAIEAATARIAATIETMEARRMEAMAVVALFMALGTGPPPP
jgi:outer membrane protein, multidrug efflux system